jgi:AcrR family transcriptional regulator
VPGKIVPVEGAIFPKLAGGPGGKPPELVAMHQRGRLMGAMVEAVSRHGYAGTTLRELVALAGVSKTTFYEHFASKEDCFLATYDAVVDQMLERTRAAFDSHEDVRDRFVAALGVPMNLAAREPAAANFVSVESLALGARGIAHRERAGHRLETMIRDGLAGATPPLELSDETVRAIAGGIRGVTYRRIRAGRGEELGDAVEELVDWGLRYGEAESSEVLRGVEAASRPVAPPPPREDGRPGWEEPPDSPRSRLALDQRQRIVRGAARAAAASGFQSLSIPAISGAAGVSNQTFYEHFASKREAFLAAFDEITGEALSVATAACTAAAGHTEAIGVAVRALLEHVAANEMLARLVFIELPTAGPVALDRVDAMLDSWIAFIEPAGGGQPPSRVRLEAATAGIWETIQVEVSHGRLRTLPDLAPELARITLMPFVGR